ncbi:hypothetical protein [Paractinoplanes rishiriensis]|uniref:hypothetical protein n=1 Tax=Paractinoplanes rishiriensis TaxID=1050105 RepID=UPI0019436155|nr:hypothetical protein [Actinoplanes rishiriensis]
MQDDDAACRIIDDRQGLVCQWWRTSVDIDPAEVADKLTPQALDQHVNHFTDPDPSTGRPFNQVSPFISLSAGTVERDAVARTNWVRRARRTALHFGTEFGWKTTAYLYPCWVILAPRNAVEIQHVAEEVRDLNTYRHYSPFQTEGEIVAKIEVPDNHIQCCEKWELVGGPAGFYRRVWSHPNPRFVRPERLTNVRELI